jgi:hypothetical protein
MAGTVPNALLDHEALIFQEISSSSSCVRSVLSVPLWRFSVIKSANVALGRVKLIGHPVI